MVRLSRIALALSLGLVLAGCARSSEKVAFDRLSTGKKNVATLSVFSGQFLDGQPIPARFSAYGSNVSPSINWGDVPRGTKSVALIVEDPDAPGKSPFVHWLAWNIPGQSHGLRPFVPAQRRVAELGDIIQGKNDDGGVGYFGPKPPPGDAPHHYHFQVFALDTTLKLKPGADRDALVSAMSGHVIGKGRVIGTFAKEEAR